MFKNGSREDLKRSKVSENIMGNNDKDKESRGKKVESVGMQHKQLFIFIAVIAIALALFGFTILHVGLNTLGCPVIIDGQWYYSHAGNCDMLTFFAWDIPRMVVIDWGYACLAISIFLFFITYLEFVINTKNVVKIKISSKKK
jgi:hypothetical protein